MLILNGCGSSSRRQASLGGEIAPSLDIVAVISITWRRRRQQYHAARRRNPRCMGDRLLHRSRKVHRAQAIVTRSRDCPRSVINALAAIAKADDGFDCATRKCFEELVIIDPAIVAAHDQSDVATRID